MQNINSRSKTKLIPFHNPAVKVEPSNLHNTTLHTVTPPPPLLAINTLSARGRIRFKQNNTVLQNRCLGKGGGGFTKNFTNLVLTETLRFYKNAKFILRRRMQAQSATYRMQQSRRPKSHWI